MTIFTILEVYSVFHFYFLCNTDLHNFSLKIGVISLRMLTFSNFIHSVMQCVTKMRRTYKKTTLQSHIKKSHKFERFIYENYIFHISDYIYYEVKLNVTKINL